jgi:tRNA(Ile)-lysidine synthase
MGVLDHGADKGAQCVSALPIAPPEADALFSDYRPMRRLLVAVSGGCDSLALLHLLSAWRQRSNDPTPDLVIVTIDHALRPAAAAEAAWVATQSRSLGLPHLTLRWNGAKPTTGLQEAAREARYRFLAAAAREHQCDAIVLAHTQDDQAETLLMRLARGSGVDGLAAMQPRSEAPDGSLLLRPLLSIPKVRLTATLQALGKTWCEDPSNSDERFERVRLRTAHAHSEALGLSPPRLAQSANRLARAREALERWTSAFLRRHVEWHDGAGARIVEAEFRRLPDEIALRTLQRVLWAFGGQERPPRLARLETLLADLQSGRRAATLGGCEITGTAEYLIVIREAGRRGLPELSASPGPSVLWDQRFTLTVRPEPDHPSVPLMIRPMDALGWRDLQQLCAVASNDNLRSGLQFALPALETALGDLPWRARLTLPSIWDGARLVAVPYLGTREPLLTQVLPWQDRCSQEFTGRGRLWKAANG